MRRRLPRLGLAGVLVVIVGFSRGLDGAVAVVLSLVVMEVDAHFREQEPSMPLPVARPGPCAPTGSSNESDRKVKSAGATLRRTYRDAVRLAAREEILAELAEDMVTAQLHADTARFHHGSAYAYAKALKLLLGEALTVYEDKRAARAATRERDLAPMRCQSRRYRPFGPDQT